MGARPEKGVCCADDSVERLTVALSGAFPAEVQWPFCKISAACSRLGPRSPSIAPNCKCKYLGRALTVTDICCGDADGKGGRFGTAAIRQSVSRNYLNVLCFFRKFKALAISTRGAA